ncbi:MAG: hypothetical protein ABIM99_04340 [Candidatus Dojkabacteria bacterium]
MKYIVVINGIGRSGKDTFVEICQQILKPLNIACYNISSIDPVKEAAGILGAPANIANKTDAVREFWHDIKMAWVKYDDGPFNYLKNKIETLGDGSFFLHMREVKEIEKFVEAFPETKTLIVSRKTNEVLLNPADSQVANAKYDFSIKNDGTLEELKKKAEDFLFKDLGVRVSA